MVGIKETKEAVVGVNEVALYFAKALSDGAQFKDFTEFYEKLTKDEDFKAKMAAAWENRQQIPAELKDVDLKEGIELVNVQLEYLPRFIDALKKPETVAAVEAKAEAALAEAPAATDPVA